MENYEVYEVTNLKKSYPNYAKIIIVKNGEFYVPAKLWTRYSEFILELNLLYDGEPRIVRKGYSYVRFAWLINDSFGKRRSDMEKVLGLYTNNFEALQAVRLDK